MKVRGLKEKSGMKVRGFNERGLDESERVLRKGWGWKWEGLKKGRDESERV